MGEESVTVAELAAKQAITEVLHRYARAVDRMDRPLADTVWHPGGTADYGPLAGGPTGAAFLDFLWPYHEGLEAHSHAVSNILITLDLEAGTAGSETYVSVWLRSYPENGVVTEMRHRGRYLDRFTLRDGVWAIQHRIYVGDIYHQTEHPAGAPAEPWGRRDPQDASYEVLGKLR